MRNLSIIICLAGALLAAMPVAAETPPPPLPPKGQPLDEALAAAAERIMNALRVIVLAIPQYQAPELLPNGDILIRRLPKPADPEQPGKTPPPQDL